MTLTYLMKTNGMIRQVSQADSNYEYNYVKVKYKEIWNNGVIAVKKICK